MTAPEQPNTQYRECEICGVDADNCLCDDPNFIDDEHARDEERRERLREEDLYLYGV